MASEIEAAIAGLKQDAQRQVAARKAAGRKARVTRVPEEEQIRRFVTGEERARLDRGEITAQEYRAYQQAMLDKLRRMGALEG